MGRPESRSGTFYRATAALFFALAATCLTSCKDRLAEQRSELALSFGHQLLRHDFESAWKQLSATGQRAWPQQKLKMRFEELSQEIRHYQPGFQPSEVTINNDPPDSTRGAMPFRLSLVDKSGVSIDVWFEVVHEGDRDRIQSLDIAAQ